MAYEEALTSISLPWGSTATATSTGHQFRFVIVNSSGKVTLPATTSDIRAIGVLQNLPKQYGDAATVAIAGVTKLNMEGTTGSAGDFVGTSTDGQGITSSTDVLYYQGVILSGSSGAAGRVVSVLLGSWSTG